MAALSRGLTTPSTKSASIPLFLVPAFAPLSSLTRSRGFSTAAPREAYHHKSGETNKQRGVSAIRRTGPRATKGLWAYPLPEPVTRKRQSKQADYEGTDNHGLWGFFNEAKEAMLPPYKEARHGMSASSTDPYPPKST